VNEGIQKLKHNQFLTPARQNNTTPKPINSLTPSRHSASVSAYKAQTPMALTMSQQKNLLS